MKKTNYRDAAELTDFAKVVAGGYNCIITDVVDVPDKEYLKIEFDIVDGDLKGYYSDLEASKGFWGGKFFKSYKETALSFFKAFITSVEESNKSFKFEDDESKLIGKKLGLVLGEEEYIGNDGSNKTRVYVDQCRSLASIKKGDFIVPEYKYLNTTSNKATPPSDGFVNIPAGIDEELPFN